MVRPKKLPDTVPLYLRVPAVLVEKLDRWVEEARAEVPGGSGITRTDLIRDLLQEAVDRRATKKKGAKR